jgi:hypothetical protein
LIGDPDVLTLPFWETYFAFRPLVSYFLLPSMPHAL